MIFAQFPNTQFHVNLSTYSELNRSGPAVVSFVEMAIELADRAGIALRVVVERERPRRARVGRPLTPGVWRSVRDVVLNGEYAYLFLFDESTRFALTVRAGDILASIARRLRNEAARARVLAAAIATPRFLNFASAIALQDTRAVCETFRQVDGACGFITLNALALVGGDQTPYEISRRISWMSRPDLYREHVRGVFWGNLLSPRHVAVLGGIERVMHEAPCRVIVPLAFQEQAEQGAYLQVSDDIERISATEIDALARYLRPVLP